MWYQMATDKYDGQSFVPLVSTDGKQTKESHNLWRENILVEYHGEGRLKNPNCPGLGPGVSVRDKAHFYAHIYFFH